MGAQEDFDKILNWELKAGSHEFPGPAGGTCINEAAIVAMGFPYKRIGSASDCPPCFSRVFSAYAIRVNDAMPDRLRNTLLMPFVMRLGGTADTPEIERERADYLAGENIRRVLPIILRKAGLNEAADACSRATSFDEARAIAWRARDEALRRRRAAWTNYPSWPPKPAAAEAEVAVAVAVVEAVAVAEAVVEAVAVAVAEAVVEAVAVAVAVAVAEAVVEAYRRFWMSIEDTVWIESVAILEEAMRIGRQPDPIDMLQVRDRMDLVRQKVGA